MMKWIATIVRVLFLALFIFIVTTGNMMLWLGLFAASLIVAIFFGRVYCGYVCPMNTVIKPVEWLSKKLKFQSSKSPKWLEKGIFPWIFLGISIAIVIIFKKLVRIELPILLIWLGISVLVTLRYKQEIFHNLICPFGALQKTFGRFAIFSKRVDKSACIGCRKCEKVCPSRAIFVQDEDKKALISQKWCHQCTNCSDVCPTSAINYSKKG